MRILNIGYTDTGGCGWRTQQALNGHNGITYDAVAKRSTWIRYPTTQPWEDRHKLAQLADIHHARNNLKILDDLPRRPAVIHHHGTSYRNDPHTANREAANRGARTLVSTVDLLEHAPEDAVWYASPYNIQRLARFRRPYSGVPLRVGHAPTVRDAKGTDQFLTSLASFQKKRGRGVDNGVRVILIERKPWLQALKIKGTCDVLFDQYTLGYGGNAVEAWAMGIPVISGAPQHILDRMLDMWGYLPFYPTTPATITDAINHMRDPNVRDEWAQRGLDHARKYYTPEYSRTLLSEVYAQALGR